jgi:uncharacterized protein
MRAIILAALIGCAAIFPTMAEAQSGSMYNQTIAGTRLELTARGETRVTPDIAIINAGVVTDAPDAATAMAQNAAKMDRVMAALKRAGVADKDIHTQSINLTPQYRYVENKPPVVTGYQATNQLNLRFRNIGKAGNILDVLVKEGINQIDGPTMGLDKPEAALDAARVDALKTVRARADLYARAAGMTVKRIVAITETSDEAVQPKYGLMQARAQDAGGATQIAPGEQSINVTVNVVFELQ